MWYTTHMINNLKSDKVKTKEEVYSFLKLYLQDAIDQSTRKTMDEDSFTLPSWSEYQAYHLGMQKAFKKIIDLIP